MNTPKHLIICGRGALTRDEQTGCRALPWGEVFIRLCSLGPGSHFVTTHKLRWLTCSSGRDDVTNMLLKLAQVQDGTHFLRYVDAERYGKTQREKVIVHVADITDFDPSLLPERRVVDSSGRVINRFLKTFADYMRSRGDVDWHETKKDVGNAKRIITLAGGLEAAIELMKAYFAMPPEHRGDDLSFTAFYLCIPRIISIRDADRIEKRASAAMMARIDDVRMPTAEETDEFVRRADAQIAKNRENPAQKRSRPVRWDEEDDEL